MVSQVTAQLDYDSQSRKWNGSSSLLALAKAEGLQIEVPKKLDVRHIAPGDALWIVYPCRPLPSLQLHELLQRGLHLLIADDFGSSATLLRAYGFSRRPLGNATLAAAKPRIAHPWTADIDQVWANRPSRLSHGSLPALLSFEQGGGLLMVGAVGAGQLIVLADASLFINRMLELPVHRRLLRRLLRGSAADEGRRLWLVLPQTQWTGLGWRERWLARSHRGLSKLSQRLSPASAASLRIGILLLIAGSLIFAIAVLSTRSAYPYPLSKKRRWQRSVR